MDPVHDVANIASALYRDARLAADAPPSSPVSALLRRQDRASSRQVPSPSPPPPRSFIPRTGDASSRNAISSVAMATPTSTTQLPLPLPQRHQAPPPPRKDPAPSIPTQATAATLASIETSNTSYSADTSPSLHQSIFSLKDGSDISNTRRTSRRRTGPLSQQSRERAALIRKLGACADCRRRRVACHPNHHNLTWEDLVTKFHRSHSIGVEDMAPLSDPGRAPSPAASLAASQPPSMHDDQQMMDMDPVTPACHQPSRLPLGEARIRTPLPSGPRLEKSLSLPGIENLKSELQNNVPAMLSTSNRGRYSSVCALLLFWQEDEDAAAVEAAVKKLAHVLEKYYHYTFHIQTIPSFSDRCKNSWRWLSQQLNKFADDRDQRDVLKIVYYTGHTYLDGNREMVLASSRDYTKASTIRWSGIQQILEEACSDVLILMDAAYYPSSKMVRQKGVLELIAASVSDEHLVALDRCSFTRALAEHLRTRASRSSPLSAAELHSILLATYPKMIQDRSPEKETITTFPAPLHCMMSGNSRLPSIFLSPIYQYSPLRNSFSCENSPQLHLSIRLLDDNVDVDSWSEWLRLMPDGIKDVRVDGSFRTTSR
ncbi:hypothetical protein RJ55_03478 [Drechmeria coniospora]|nr:hypothetical protein RJ55_03478 [Drechmeria coniospora]